MTLREIAGLLCIFIIGTTVMLISAVGFKFIPWDSSSSQGDAAALLVIVAIISAFALAILIENEDSPVQQKIDASDKS